MVLLSYNYNWYKLSVPEDNDNALMLELMCGSVQQKLVGTDCIKNEYDWSSIWLWGQPNKNRYIINYRVYGRRYL